MKFLKPVLIILILVALTYTVSASNVSFNEIVTSKLASSPNPTSLPIHGDLLFAFTAIFSLGGYMVLKK
jgi:hypothetical protein